MLGDSFTKWVWDGRRSLIGWTLAISLVGGFYAAFWPTMRDPGIQEAIANYPQALLDALNYTDLATPAGYLNATVYGLVVGILLIVFAVVAGARTIAGDEEAGTLDLILAHPVGRERLSLQRFAALGAGLVLISFVFWIVMIALAGPAQLEGISIGRFAAMHLNLVLFGAFFGAVTFAVGAATGHKAVALTAGSAVAVAGYLANGIIPQVEGFEWVKGLSPFDWLTGADPLTNGIPVGDSLMMAGLIAVLVAAGTWAFARRDIAV